MADKAKATAWLRDYVGSIDSYALLMAHHAGQTEGEAALSAALARAEAAEARLAEAERMLADAAGLMRNAMSYADALTSGNVAHQRGQILGSLNFYVPRIDAFLAPPESEAP